jgi:predicted lipoprotein with Yx(FWY)xxD motif
MSKQDNESAGHEEALDMRRTTARTMRGVVLLMVAVTALSVMALGAGAATKTTTTISTAKNSKLGTILVAGTTVYTLKGKDCSGACLKTWTPVALPDGTMAATAGNGVDGSKLGTQALSDGSMQVTYAGAPLYWNNKDKKAGQVHGNTSDKYGKWSAVVVKKAGSGGSGGSNAGTGGASF